MAWSFETDPDFQQSLDWIDEFTRTEIEPLDLVFREPGDPWDPNSPAAKAMAPLREIVKSKKLWACHLEPELGGQDVPLLAQLLVAQFIPRVAQGVLFHFARNREHAHGHGAARIGPIPPGVHRHVEAGKEQLIV